MWKQQLERYLVTDFGVIHADACDYNGHFNEAQSLVLLTEATDTVLEAMHLDPENREAMNFSAFTVQNQLFYLSEAHKGEEVVAYSQLLAWDAKRARIFHRLVTKDEQRLVTEMETLLLAVDMETRRSAPWPEPVKAALENLMEQHKTLAISDNAGCGISKPALS